MKVNVEIDCSPEEARRFMGLPDVTQANEAYLEAITRAIQGAGQGVGSLDQLQDYAKALAPMGQMGLQLFQQFLEGSAGFTNAVKSSSAKSGGKK